MSVPRTRSSRCTGFPPIAAPNARVLVLGSMPSVASLAKHQYYGHPRNAFWPIMGRLFGAGLELPYEDRVIVLREQGVAVWDVLRACLRRGSLDTSIVVESERPNDFDRFFRAHPHVRAVFFNGQKAESSFQRHVAPRLRTLNREFLFARLPSTSPAHAGRSLAEKVAAWKVVRTMIDE